MAQWTQIIFEKNQRGKQGQSASFTMNCLIIGGVATYFVFSYNASKTSNQIKVVLTLYLKYQLNYQVDSFPGYPVSS